MFGTAADKHPIASRPRARTKNAALSIVALSTLVLSILAMAIAATPAGAAARQRSFANPAAAIDALIAANRRGHLARLSVILGPDSGKLIHSGDAVADRRARARFVAAYDEAHKLDRDGADKATLIVGAHEWPFPIPLVRARGRWRFDTNAGVEEILNRRVGRNELEVIQICRAFVTAEREYAAKRLGPGGAPDYAQHFVSAAGQRDGLYWPVKPGEEESPLGPLIASARAAGYRPGTPHIKPRPYYGYFFRILTAQGPDAPGGAKNYVVDNRMTGGFALIAYPATYGDSGIMTFIVNQNGIVYQRNLGPDTTRIAAAFTAYDPDAGWQASKP